MQIYWGKGGGGGNKVHYGHMKMVNSRDYNGNGYELWQNDFWDHVGDKRILMIG